MPALPTTPVAATARSPALSRLPALGVGVVYMPRLHAWIAEAGEAIGQVEVEPQQHWLHSVRDGIRLDRSRFDAIDSLHRPCLLHSVGCPVGATDPGFEGQAQALRASVDRLDPPWVSEHLSFLRFCHGDVRGQAGFLLPPMHDAATVNLAARNLRRLRDIVARPVLFETGVNYLRPQPGQMPDGEFFAAVAEAADCGILLDLHNVLANARNGRQPLDALLSQLPLERVVELHLAGGEALHGYWLDAHSGPCEAELMAMAAELLPQLPGLRAITYEVMDEAVAVGRIDRRGFHTQIESMWALWERRPSEVPDDAPATRFVRLTGSETPGGAAIAPAHWEAALASRVLGWPAQTRLDARLDADPGCRLLRELAEAARAGTLADVFGLSLTLIGRSCGEGAVMELFEAFWQTLPPQPFASDEAEAFAGWMRGRFKDIPLLADVLGFELACCRALTQECPQTSCWHHDPVEALTALRAGKLPQAAVLPRPVDLEIAPGHG